MSCLEKTRARRPQTARELSKLLEGIQGTENWTMEQADQWWRKHERAVATSDDSSQADDPSFSFDQAKALRMLTNSTQGSARELELTIEAKPNQGV